MNIAFEYALHNGEKMKIVGESIYGDTFKLRDSVGNIYEVEKIDLKPIFGQHVLDLSNETVQRAFTDEELINGA